MDAIGGIAVALDPQNLLFVFIGVVVGTVIGVLPGLGPTATIALLLPVTYSMDPLPAVIMLAGIYYGSMYGGTITSVLLRLPGEAASVVTTFDGYQMAKQGRAGPALGIAAIGSFIGGTVSVVGLMLLAPQLSELAVSFGPPEFAMLALLGILLVSYLSTISVPKAVIAASLGLLLASVGQDPILGSPRFTLDIPDLFGGIDFIPIAMGLFGVGEILYNLEQGDDVRLTTAKVGRVWPTKQDLRDSRGPIARGSVLGFLIGILPGGGGIVSSLASYTLEKRASKNPERFGHGAIQGVAGPETANNAGSTSAFVPLLTLGLPSNAVLALIFGALLLQGVTPGPTLITSHPDIFWGVIGSMYVGNVMLLILNLPLVFLFVQILRVKSTVLLPLALLVTLLGVFSVNNSSFDMWILLVFGCLGYLMRKAGYEPGPLVLAFVLGGILEQSFRQSLLLGNGDLQFFVSRPGSGTLAAMILVGLALTAFGAARRVRRPQPIEIDDPDETPYVDHHASTRQEDNR